MILKLFTLFTVRDLRRLQNNFLFSIFLKKLNLYFAFKEVEMETRVCANGDVESCTKTDNDTGIIENVDDLFHLAAMINIFPEFSIGCTRYEMNKLIVSIHGQNVVSYEEEYGKHVINFMQENIYGFVAVNELNEFDSMQKNATGSILVDRAVKISSTQSKVIVTMIAVKGKQQQDHFIVGDKHFKIYCNLIPCMPWFDFGLSDPRTIYTIYVWDPKRS